MLVRTPECIHGMYRENPHDRNGHLWRQDKAGMDSVPRLASGASVMALFPAR